MNASRRERPAVPQQTLNGARGELAKYHDEVADKYGEQYIQGRVQRYAKKNPHASDEDKAAHQAGERENAKLVVEHNRGMAAKYRHQIANSKPETEETPSSGSTGPKATTKGDAPGTKA